MPAYYEFFAGGGMARAGLGENWECLLANDFDPKKAASYAANWGEADLAIEDVATLTPVELPGRADLAWASFPCQDLSLAGGGAGLKGSRSGTFWPFWNLMKGLAAESRSPKTVVLENVCGALSSHGGQDFAAIGTALSDAGYRFGALIVNAVHFVPQSRPRLFIVGVLKNVRIPQTLAAAGPSKHWHTPALVGAYAKLPERARENWIWWQLPSPPVRNTALADIIENDPDGVTWHSEAETRRLLAMMSAANLSKLNAAKLAGHRRVGTVYRRTRTNGPAGEKVQRAEVRFDDIAGCLRTPAGGSSRQTILVVENDSVRSRLLSPREAARLMGLPDSYKLPDIYNEAYHLAGDGVVVPVVRFLAANLLEPLIAPPRGIGRKAA